MSRTAPPVTPSGGVVKRLLVGRAMASSGLEHTLLPKILALPVFSSDALSSVAYATEEILLVLLGVSMTAGYLALPVSMAVSTLMVIVILSYRETVKAYPNGGRRLHREQGEPGRDARSGRGLGVARRLHADGRGVHGGRRVRHHLGGPVPRRSQGDPVDRVRLADHPRQPARRPGVRDPVRHPHLRLHPLRVPPGGRRVREVRRRMSARRAHRVHPRPGHDGRHRHPVVPASCVLFRIHRSHRRRGDLQWRSCLPPSAGAQRGHHAGDDGRDLDLDVPFDLVARHPHPQHHRERPALRAGPDRATRCSVAGRCSTSSRRSRPRS